MHQDNARPRTHDECVELAEQVIGSHYEPYSVAEGQAEELVDAIERSLIGRIKADTRWMTDSYRNPRGEPNPRVESTRKTIIEWLDTFPLK